MQNDLEEYRPFYDIAFNFATSLSKDDAVLAMLGWMKRPFREVSEKEHKHYYDYPDDEEEIYEPNLTDILRNLKESADADYSIAKFEKLGDEIVAEKLAEIKKSHLLIDTAYRFLCAINDELAKGEESALRIDQLATTNPKFPFITIGSLDKWARKKHKIEIFKSPLTTTFADLNRSQQEIEESLSGGVNSKNLHLTLALLVEKFAENNEDYRHKNGTPIVKKIAKLYPH